MWEEAERRTKQSRRRADSRSVLKCAPARHTAVLNRGCAADLCVLASLLHPPAAPSQFLLSADVSNSGVAETKRLSVVCASLGGLKTYTGSSIKWGTKADSGRNRQGGGGERGTGVGGCTAELLGSDKVDYTGTQSTEKAV